MIYDKCSKCRRNISRQNIAKHEHICNGEGPWIVREQKAKKRNLAKCRKGLTCCYCHKIYHTIQGYKGHMFRAHTKEGKRVGRKAIRRLKQLIREGKLNKRTSVGYKHTKDAKDRISAKRVEQLNANAFYSKRCVYRGITLDSSFEFRLAKSMSKSKIKWLRPKSIKYKDRGQTRRYLPDFYLPQFDVYLDTKNDYLIKKDKRKLSLVRRQNKIKLLVIDKHHLSWEQVKKML
jgi:hypothetical protein